MAAGRLRPNPWVHYPAPAGGRRARILCFPYAGAGAAAFRTWRRRLPAEIEIGLVQLPGREARLGESLPVGGLPALAAAAVEGLAAELDPGLPLVLFGHSMGALLAFEVARQLDARGDRAPDLLVVSGHRAPHLPWPRPPVRDAPDDDLVRELERLGGTPPEVLRHPELLALLKPIFRADLRACETYRLAPGHPLPCPLLAYGGVADPEAPPASLDAWREHTREGFERRLFPGGHFFLHTAEADVLACLAHDAATLPRR